MNIIKTNPIIRTLKIVILLLAVTLLLSFWLICLVGSVNHSSINLIPFGYLGLSIGGLYFVISAIKQKLKWKENWLNHFIFLTIVLAGLSILIFDYFNIMVNYEVWFHRGLPHKPFHN